MSGSNLIRSSCKAKLADWKADEYRADYNEALTSIPDDLQTRMSAEATEWDSWASQRLARGQRVSDETFEEWLSSNRTYRQVIKRCPTVTELAGRRVLDIGGTCTESVTMLRSGAARVDQIEVSPVTQRLALNNLITSGVEWEGRVFFHTVPAERLPFSDNLFDIVFSKATIHHVGRPAVWPEINRVLQPGGVTLFYESWTYHRLLKLLPYWRWVKRLDVGTDVPLSLIDIQAMRSQFHDVWFYPFGFLSRIWAPTFGKVKPFKSLTKYVRTLEFTVGNGFGLCNYLGHVCLIVATKSPQR